MITERLSRIFRRPTRTIKSNQEVVVVGDRGLEDQDVRNIIDLAVSLWELRDPVALKEYFEQRAVANLRNSDFNLAMASAWEDSAIEILERHTKERQLDKKSKAHRTVLQGFRSVYMTLALGDIESVDLFERAHGTRKIDGSETRIPAKGICPASGLVKQWVATAEECFQSIIEYKPSQVVSG